MAEKLVFTVKLFTRLRSRNLWNFNLLQCIFLNLCALYQSCRKNYSTREAMFYYSSVLVNNILEFYFFSPKPTTRIITLFYLWYYIYLAFKFLLHYQKTKLNSFILIKQKLHVLQTTGNSIFITLISWHSSKIISLVCFLQTYNHKSSGKEAQWFLNCRYEWSDTCFLSQSFSFGFANM